MGLISLVTWPITGPARAGWWVLEQIVEQAEAEFYDEQRILEQMRHLAAQLDAGELSEDEHARQEEALVHRLLEARTRREAEEPT
jgi:hypothetical protein